MPVWVPYLPAEAIERDAEALLVEFAQARGTELEPPIPIEDVVEKYLKLKIDFDDLPEKIQLGEPKTLVSEAPPSTPTMELIEKAYIKWVLETTEGNKARAAEILGIDTSTLYRKIDRYSL